MCADFGRVVLTSCEGHLFIQMLACGLAPEELVLNEARPCPLACVQQRTRSTAKFAGVQPEIRVLRLPAYPNHSPVLASSYLKHARMGCLLAVYSRGDDGSELLRGGAFPEGVPHAHFIGAKQADLQHIVL